MRRIDEAISQFAKFLDCPVAKIQFLFETYQTVGDIEIGLKSTQPEIDKQKEKGFTKSLKAIESGLMRLTTEEQGGWLTHNEFVECYVNLLNKVENKPAYQRMIARERMDRALRDVTGKGRGRTVINWAQEDDITTKALIFGLVSYALYYRDSQCFDKVAEVLQGTGVLSEKNDDEIRRRYDNVVDNLSHRMFVHNYLRELSQTTRTLIANEQRYVEVRYSLPIWESLACPDTDPLFSTVRSTFEAFLTIDTL